MTAVLLRKDLRLFRPVVWGAIAAALLCWGVLPLAQALQWQFRTRNTTSVQNPNWSEPRLRDVWSWRVREAAGLTLPGVVILGAAVGGLAFAAERRSRSAEFLAMLPVSRRRWVGTKLAAAAFVCGLAFVANWSVCTVAVYGRQNYAYMPDWRTVESGVLYRLASPWVRYAIVFFALAWLLRKTAPATRWTVAAVLSLFFMAIVLAATDFSYWTAWNDRFGRKATVGWFASHSDATRLLLVFLPTVLAVFGLAWAISAVMRSASFAATLSVAVVAAVVFPWFTMTYTVENDASRQLAVLTVLAIGQTAFGLFAVAAGSVVQLKRQSP